MNMPKENLPTDQKKPNKQNKKYAFVQKEGDDFTSIKLLQPPYKGVIFKYGKVGFGKDENPDGTRSMKFDYDILFNPHETDLDNKEFIDYIGDMLIDFLDEKLKKGEPIE